MQGSIDPLKHNDIKKVTRDILRLKNLINIRIKIIKIYKFSFWVDFAQNEIGPFSLDKNFYQTLFSSLIKSFCKKIYLKIFKISRVIAVWENRAKIEFSSERMHKISQFFSKCVKIYLYYNILEK